MPVAFCASVLCAEELCPGSNLGWTPGGGGSLEELLND